MLTLRRILVPTDFAPCADRAVAHAIFLAAAHGAELHLLHLTPVTGTDPETPHPYPVPEGVRRVDVTRRALSVPEEIVRYAADMDLVVMGTHGRRGLRRLALGSTTEQVLRDAPCPVLAVGLDAPHATPDAVERILVPVDFSAPSASALQIADALAALYDAQVDAIHAAYLPELPVVYGLGVYADVSMTDIVQRSEAALADLLTTHVAPERRGAALVEVGPPSGVLLDAAHRTDAGLLVMPTHGRHGIDRLAFGSVAEQVLRRAPCAVFAFPLTARLPLPLLVETGDAVAS